MKTTRELLWNLVSAAREHCCGSAVMGKAHLLRDINAVLNFARKVEVNEPLINKLLEVRRLVRNAVQYKDRLHADRLLCEILNHDLKE